MSIVFQSGEFYFESISTFWSTYGGHIVTLLGVVITGFFGVYLFNKGIEKERRLNDEFRAKEKKDIEKRKLSDLQFFKKHFITLTEGVVKNSIKQKDDYQKYANKLIKNPRQQHFPIHRTHENLTRLLKIDTQTLLRLFEHYGIDDESFIKLLSSLDYLNEIFQVIPKDIYEGNGNTIVNLSQRLIEIRSEILSIATDFIGKEKIGNPYYKQNPLWITINDLVLNYYDNNDGVPSVDWDYNKLVIPIKDKLLTEEFKYFVISNKLLNLSKTGGDIVFSIVEGNTQMAKDILKTCEYIDDECSKVNDLKEIINNAR